MNVEVCEILCWLSAACRANTSSGTDESGPAICLPKLSRARTEDLAQPVLLVEHECRPIHGESIVQEQGTCWKLILWNPTVTLGYPIPTREPSVKGLQIDLKLMTNLCEISRAMLYGKFLMLKGVCNMLVPTAVSATSIVWHYMLNKDLSWMSHNHAEEVCQNVAEVGFEKLETATTHYVGWLPVAEINTGTCQASLGVL